MILPPEPATGCELMKKTRQSGFTLIELLITMAVLALLVSIAYPSFQGQMRKGRRAQAISTMQEYQLLQEQYRTNNTTYGTLAELGITTVTDEYYTYSMIAPDATGYTIRAVPLAGNDQAQDTPCLEMNIDEANNRTPDVCF
jgi:type IV pilus assembly protein PilE